MFIIDNVKCKIETAFIVGMIDDWEEEFYWEIHVHAKSTDFGDVGIYSPKISNIHLPHRSNDKQLEMLKWDNVEAYDREKDDWVGDLYLYDAHQYSSQLLLKRLSFDTFQLKWEGQFDTSLDWDKNKQLEEFQINT